MTYISDIKKRGRPRVECLPLTVRFSPEQLALLDDWIARYGHDLSRPEAVRLLVERTMSSRKGFAKLTSKEFEITRLLMVRSARSGEIGKATGFAWANRVYPLFTDGPLIEAFRSDFATSADQVGQVLKTLDEKSEQQNGKVAFYSLETALDVGHGGSMTRGQLIDCCRYIYLDGRFSKKVWDSLTVNGSGPVESQSLASPDIRDEWDFPVNA